MSIPKLRMEGINRYFSESFSISDVSLDLYSGEVHAIIGENGSGKSTLIKMISGLIKPDSGIIYIDGNPVSIHSVSEARQYKIHCVWQDLNLYPNLSVAENIYANMIHRKSTLFKTVNMVKLYSDCSEVFHEFGIVIDPSLPASKLGFAQKQLVEMVRAYVSGAEIVVFDEPSAAFTVKEKEILFKIIRILKERNTAIFYITHILEEIEQIADRLTILHQGRVVSTRDVKKTTKEEIIRLLSVPVEKNRYPKLEVKIGRTILSVRNLCAANILKDISFELKKSEILGITGLMGSGRSLLAQCLFGLTPISSGSIEVNGTVRKITCPNDAIDAGIALLPEDRATASIFGCLDLGNNVTVSSLKRFEQFLYLHSNIMTDVTDSYIKKLSIKPGHPNDLLMTYSGGNQQKTAVARWIMSRSKIYILDEPTRGVDVASKTDIYNAILDLVTKGASVVFISSDIEEIMGMCDRVLVLSEGMISGEFRRDEATKEGIMYKAALRSE